MPTEFVTLKVSVNVPLALALPVSVSVPPPDEVKVTPVGSLPDGRQRAAHRAALWESGGGAVKLGTVSPDRESPPCLLRTD